MASEPEPHPGAFPGAAAGPAGRAVVAPPHSAAAALSNASGIIKAGMPSDAVARPRQKIAPWPAAGDAQPNDPAAWGYAARSPMTGKIWRTTPPSQAATSAARPPFQRANHQTNSFETALNLFHSVQTKSCLGHCITRGIGLRRQATILRLRGAVLFGARGNGAGELEGAPGVETLAGRFLPGRSAAGCCSSAHEPRNFGIPLPLCLPLCRGTGDFHESQRRRIYAYQVGNPGVLEVAISDR